MANQDEFLQNIISRTTGARSEAPLELRVSLNVGGSLIVGTLVSEGEYLDGVGTQLTAELGNAYIPLVVQSMQEAIQRAGQSRTRQQLPRRCSPGANGNIGTDL